MRAINIPLLVCPTYAGRIAIRPSAPAGGGTWTASNYAACYHDVEAPIDVDNHGVMYLNSHISQKDVTDGTTHTIYVGEKLGDDAGFGLDVRHPSHLAEYGHAARCGCQVTPILATAASCAAGQRFDGRRIRFRAPRRSATSSLATAGRCLSASASIPRCFNSSAAAPTAGYWKAVLHAAIDARTPFHEAAKRAERSPFSCRRSTPAVGKVKPTHYRDPREDSGLTGKLKGNGALDNTVINPL